MLSEESFTEKLIKDVRQNAAKMVPVYARKRYQLQQFKNTMGYRNQWKSQTQQTKHNNQREEHKKW